jgi:signal transduction histidine kinase
MTTPHDPDADEGTEQSRRLAALGQLAGGVAHDFNNLLGAILTLTELLGRRLSDPLDLEDLQQIRDATNQAVALTYRLQAVGSSGLSNPEALDLNEVARSVATEIEPTLDSQHQLRLEVGPAPLMCEVDRRQISQVITELMRNALDAMPAGGDVRITLRASEDARRAILDVTDSGVGMTPDVRSRAFEPFFTTKWRSLGTGLGLAVVYGLVAQNGGEISIVSTSGQGTTVTLALPRADTEAASASSPVAGAQE